MRMTDNQRIRAAAILRKHFGADSTIRLFGSRADDSKRGGDYDFFVETDVEDVLEARNLAQTELFLSAEFLEQRVDIVVRNRKSEYQLPIYRIAIQEGVVL